MLNSITHCINILNKENVKISYYLYYHVFSINRSNTMRKILLPNSFLSKSCAIFFHFCVLDIGITIFFNIFQISLQVSCTILETMFGATLKAYSTDFMLSPLAKYKF